MYTLSVGSHEFYELTNFTNLHVDITYYSLPITHILIICHFVSSLIHQYANMMTSFYKMSFKMGKLADLVWWHSI